MFDNYGNYEVSCLTKRYYNDIEKEIVIIVEAANENEAKRKAEKQLKSSGNKHFKIISIKFQKGISNKIKSVQSNSVKTSSSQRKAGIILALVGIGILILIFVLVVTGVVG